MHKLADLQAKAMECLRAPRPAIRGVGMMQAIACAVRHESFGTVESVLLCRRKTPYKGMSNFLIRTEWHRSVDMESYRVFNRVPDEPTMLAEWKPTDADWSERIQKRLASCSVVVLIENGAIQLDATHHEFCLPDARFRWGETAPPQWEQLAAVAYDILNRWGLEHEYVAD